MTKILKLESLTPGLLEVRSMLRKMWLKMRPRAKRVKRERRARRARKEPRKSLKTLRLLGIGFHLNHLDTVTAGFNLAPT